MKKPLIICAWISIFAACSTSKISVRKDALKQIQTIAVVPFTSGIADNKVTRECTETFRSSLIASGFSVVEREKLDKVLKEKELAQSGLVDNKAIEAGQFAGAQGTMLGEITAHEMKSEEYDRAIQEPGPYPVDPNTGKADTSLPRPMVTKYVKDKRETYEFQVVVRLISNVDGQTVLTLQNEYPVQVYTADRPGIKPANLDQYRGWVLSQMAKDLEKSLKSARE